VFRSLEAELCRAAGIVTTQTIIVNGKTKTILRHTARPHDLRHTYASVLVSGGKSLELIGSLSGHSKASTVMRYAHLHLQTQRDAVETAASIFAPAGQGAEVIKHPKVAS
jgi:site-specific recombinase XerD